MSGSLFSPFGSTNPTTAPTDAQSRLEATVARLERLVWLNVILVVGIVALFAISLIP